MLPGGQVKGRLVGSRGGIHWGLAPRVTWLDQTSGLRCRYQARKVQEGVLFGFPPRPTRRSCRCHFGKEERRQPLARRILEPVGKCTFHFGCQLFADVYILYFYAVGVEAFHDGKC